MSQKNMTFVKIYRINIFFYFFKIIHEKRNNLRNYFVNIYIDFYEIMS